MRMSARAHFHTQQTQCTVVTRDKEKQNQWNTQISKLIGERKVIPSEKNVQKKENETIRQHERNPMDYRANEKKNWEKRKKKQQVTRMMVKKM